MSFSQLKNRFKLYATLVFERFFKRELDMEDEIKLVELIEKVRLDRADFLSFVQDPGPKKLDQTVTKETTEGAFGVPTFVFQGELFWGYDRMGGLTKTLKAANGYRKP